MFLVFISQKMAPGERQPWKISDTRSLPNADERTPAENSFYPVYKYSNETMSFMSKLRFVFACASLSPPLPSI